MQKYGFDDVRNVLERASARETAARVAIGAPAARRSCAELGIEVISHVVQIGSVKVPGSLDASRPCTDLDAIDASPVRCADAGGLGAGWSPRSIAIRQVA